MGIYYDPDEPAIIPDGFVSIGVPRLIDEELRLSYVLWEENVVPIFVLEVVSKNYRGEYSTKKQKYVEADTHLIIDAFCSPYRIGEKRGALKLLRSVSDGMLLMWDRGLHSFKM